MASATAQKIRYEVLRSLAFGSIGAGYVGIGAAFANPVRMLMIDNLTDQNVIISFDGINDHTIVAAHSGKVLDYASNKMAPADHLEQAVGERVYVKAVSVLPTLGSVYVSVIYAAAS